MANHCMIQVAGMTYRIEHKRGTYDVYRLLDDLYMGSFSQYPKLHVVCMAQPQDDILQIARSALHAARLPFSPQPAPAKTAPRATMLRLLTALSALLPAA